MSGVDSDAPQLSLELAVRGSDAEIVILPSDRQRETTILRTSQELRALISNKQAAERFFSKLSGPWPGGMMDLLQFEMSQTSRAGHRRRCLHHLRFMADHYGILPPSFLLHGVSREGNDPISGGGFADVWKGRYNDQLVCLKCPRLFLTTTDQERRKLFKLFNREALVWKQLDHPNVMQFLGVSMEVFPFSFCLISPWMSNGNLRVYLENNPDYDRLKAVREVAEGMNYLHNYDPVIVHADIRCANILISDQGTCRLADFGLTRVSESQFFTTTSSGTAGTVRWMAPEALNPSDGDERHVQTPRDVYAFGCTVLEIYTLLPPFHNLRQDAAVWGAVVNGIRPSRPAEISSNMLWNLIEQCWRSDPWLRPSSLDILSMLEAFLILSEEPEFEIPQTEDDTIPSPQIWPPSDPLPTFPRLRPLSEADTSPNQDPFGHSSLDLFQLKERLPQLYGDFGALNGENLAPRPMDWREDYCPLPLRLPVKHPSEVPEITDPITRELHPLLQYAVGSPTLPVPVVSDLREESPFRNISFPNLGRQWNDHDLKQNATEPATTFLRIVHPRLPWYIDIRTRPNAITIRDVITQVHQQMNTGLEERHFYNKELTDEQRSSIEVGFHARCIQLGSRFQEGIDGGRRRVDFLGLDDHKYVWIGLVEGTNGIWEMKTRRSL